MLVALQPLMVVKYVLYYLLSCPKVENIIECAGSYLRGVSGVSETPSRVLTL